MRAPKMWVAPLLLVCCLAGAHAIRYDITAGKRLTYPGSGWIPGGFAPAPGGSDDPGTLPFTTGMIVNIESEHYGQFCNVGDASKEGGSDQPPSDGQPLRLRCVEDQASTAATGLLIIGADYQTPDIDNGGKLTFKSQRENKLCAVDAKTGIVLCEEHSMGASTTFVVKRDRHDPDLFYMYPGSMPGHLCRPTNIRIKDSGKISVVDDDDEDDDAAQADVATDDNDDDDEDDEDDEDDDAKDTDDQEGGAAAAEDAGDGSGEAGGEGGDDDDEVGRKKKHHNHHSKKHRKHKKKKGVLVRHVMVCTKKKARHGRELLRITQAPWYDGPAGEKGQDAGADKQQEAVAVQ